MFRIDIRAACDGRQFGGTFQRTSDMFYTQEKSDFDATERAFYVIGQIATAIHFDFCKIRCLRVEREDNVFPDGSPNNVVLILEGHGNDYKDHKKILDTYHGVSMQDAKFWAASPRETVDKHLRFGILRPRTELANIFYVRHIVELYENNRASYVHKKVDE